MILELVFSVVLLSSPTLALVFADRTEIVSVQSAQREFKRLERMRMRDSNQSKRYAALVQALGVQRELTEYQACATGDPARHQPLCETIRGRRLPLQKLSRN